MKVILLCLVGSVVASRLSTGGDALRQVTKLLNQVADERESEFNKMKEQKDAFECWAKKAIKGHKKAKEEARAAIEASEAVMDDTKTGTMDKEEQAAQQLEDDTKAYLGRSHTTRISQSGALAQKEQTLGNLKNMVEGMANDQTCNETFKEMTADTTFKKFDDTKDMYNASTYGNPEWTMDKHANASSAVYTKTNFSNTLLIQGKTASAMMCEMMKRFYDSVEEDFKTAKKQYDLDLKADSDYYEAQKEAYATAKEEVEGNKAAVERVQAAVAEHEKLVNAQLAARKDATEAIDQINKRLSDTMSDWGNYSAVAQQEIHVIREVAQDLMTKNAGFLQERSSKPKISLSQVVTSLDALAMKSPQALAFVSEIRELKDRKGSKAFLQAGGAVADAITKIRNQIGTAISDSSEEDKSDRNALNDCATHFQNVSRAMMNAASAADKKDTERVKEAVAKQQNAALANEANQTAQEFESEFQQLQSEQDKDEATYKAARKTLETTQGQLTTARENLEGNITEANKLNDFIQLSQAPNVGFNAEYEADSRGPAAIIQQMEDKTGKQMDRLDDKHNRDVAASTAMKENLNASKATADQNEATYQAASDEAGTKEAAARTAQTTKDEATAQEEDKFAGTKDDDTYESCRIRGETFTQRMNDRASERSDLQKVRAILQSVAKNADKSDKHTTDNL